MAAAWLTQDPDPTTRRLLTDQLTAARRGNSAALELLTDEFAGRLVFGTAGLRAAMGPGPNRMNRVVVCQAAAGLASWLTARGHTGGPVLIGYDARHNSDVFARDTAEILAGAGFRVMLTEQPTPTPLVAFGIRHFGCVAAVVVTASHNPASDNGYKVYLGDGSQIIPPTDAEIAAAIEQVATSPLERIARSDVFDTIDEELIRPYVDRAVSLLADKEPRDLRWGYTAMHGVGWRIVQQVVRQAGLPAPLVVSQQLDPDPDFPTVSFPNPEEPGAMDLAINLGHEQDLDVVIATDPDADRCAVATLIDGTWRRLSGDELGVLLGDAAIRRGTPGTLACSVVSSTMLGDIAAANGRDFVTTLTGFKWIGRVPNLAFGYEEAIGYCCDPAYVADKDGITATVEVLRLVGELKAEGQTLADRLAELNRLYGVHATSQLAIRVDDLNLIQQGMTRLRAMPPTRLAGEPVRARDLLVDTRGLPPTDAVELSGPTVRVVARPSGTEPKLKCYLEARRPQPEANRTLDLLAEQMHQALGL